MFLIVFPSSSNRIKSQIGFLKTLSFLVRPILFSFKVNLNWELMTSFEQLGSSELRLSSKLWRQYFQFSCKNCSSSNICHRTLFLVMDYTFRKVFWCHLSHLQELWFQILCSTSGSWKTCPWFSCSRSICSFKLTDKNLCNGKLLLLLGSSISCTNTEYWIDIFDWHPDCLQLAS